jgi:hypothetical protein
MHFVRADTKISKLIKIGKPPALPGVFDIALCTFKPIAHIIIIHGGYDFLSIFFQQIQKT